MMRALPGGHRPRLRLVRPALGGARGVHGLARHGARAARPSGRSAPEPPKESFGNDPPAASARRRVRFNPPVAEGHRMVFLGFRQVRACRTDLRARAAPRRRAGRQAPNPRLGRGIPDAVVASRTAPADDPARDGTGRRGRDAPPRRRARARRAACRRREEGRVDLTDLGRRARRLLAASARPAEGQKLF